VVTRIFGVGIVSLCEATSADKDNKGISMKLIKAVLLISACYLLVGITPLMADGVVCEGEPDGSGGTATGIGPSRDVYGPGLGSGGGDYLLGEITPTEKTEFGVRVEALRMFINAMSSAVSGDDCNKCPDDTQCAETLSGSPFPGGESTGVFTLDENGIPVQLGFQVLVNVSGVTANIVCGPCPINA
jgi:hypothetical protein